MILWISNSGECLPIAYRMQKAGEVVSVYIHNSRYRNNYEGLVNRITASKLPANIRKAEAVIFDILRPNEKTSADRHLLKIFRCPQNTPEVFGAVADKIRKKALVIGASSETATWELDRAKGEKVADFINVRIPETQEFQALSQGARFLKNKKNLWVFKPNNNQDLDLTYMESYPGELKSKLEGEYKERLGDKFDFILQKKIEGVEISTEGWFNGERFVHFNHTIEDKRLMNANLGPAIGSQSNTVWIKQNEKGLLAPELKKLTPKLKQTGYIGPIDINCIISEEDHKPYFLEWSCRLGWDAFYCLLSLLNGKISSFFLNRFQQNFHNGFASSQRISIPPFPYNEPSLLKEYAQRVEITAGFDEPNFWMQDIKLKEKAIKCTGADGILGVMATKGNSLGGSVGNMYRTIDKLRIASTLQYRTDATKRPEKAIKQLSKWGIDCD